MVRRLAALIFVLAIAGQAWASACICDNTGPVHSCCKRKAERNDYVSSPGCCSDENCVTNRTSTPTPGICQANVTITTEVVLTPSYPPVFCQKTFRAEPAADLALAGRYKPFARPPDLYVRHHAFLI